MKSALKKVLSLMLVAMLLVTAIPFQASAATFQNQYLTFVYKLADGTEVYRYDGTTAFTQEFTDEQIIEGAKGFVPGGYSFESVDLGNPVATPDKVTYTVTVKKIVVQQYAVVIKLIVENEGSHLYNVGSTTDPKAEMSRADALIQLGGQGSDYEITSSTAVAEVTDSEYVYPFTAVKKAAPQPTNPQPTNPQPTNPQPTNPQPTAPQEPAVTKNFQVKFVCDGVVVATYTGSNLGVTAPLSQDLANGFWDSLKMTGYTNPTVNTNNPIIEDGRRIWTVSVVKSATTTPTTPGTPAYNAFQVKFVHSGSVIATYTGNNEGLDAPLSQDLANQYWQAVRVNGYFNPTVNGKNPIIENNRRIWTVDLTKDSSTNNKFPYKVYLHIYLNNKVDEPSKTVNITDGIAVDGVVSRAEVENLVMQHYTAKNSAGIKYDGLYMARGNWVNAFATDSEKYEEITGIKEMRQESEVHINVMITNASVRNTTTNNANANSTNPKTGDSIVMTVSALGITASALAAAYYVSKKRMAR